MTGTAAALPDEAAFGAAAERKSDDDQAQNGGDALLHGGKLSRLREPMRARSIRRHGRA